MTARRIGATLIAVTAVMALTACTTSVPPEVEASRSAAMSSLKRPAIPEPTLQQLQALLDRALDPKVPTKDKLDTVEDGEKSPELFEKITQAKQETNATIKLSGQIIPTDPTTRTVHVEMSIPGQPPQGSEVKFIYDKKKWKISKSYMCNTISLLMPDSVPAVCNT